MTDKTTDREQNKLSLASRGKLGLKTGAESGKVRQSFPHGRSKTVTVEVKRKRAIVPEQGLGGARSGRAGDAAEAARIGGLSDEERASRARALKALQREAATRPIPEPAIPAAADAGDLAVAERVEAEVVEPVEVVEPEPELTPEERELLALREAEAEERRKADDEARRRDEEAAKLAAEEEAKRAASRPQETAAAPAARRGAAEPEAEAGDAREARVKRPGRPDARRPAAPPKRSEPRRRVGKLTIAQALDGETVEERQRSLASVRRARERERQRQRELADSPQKIFREVIVPETITVQELANRMAERGGDVVKTLMRLGVMASVSQTIDADTAELVVSEFGHRIRRVAESDVEEGLVGGPDDPSALILRAPVVTVMGHVDHGKTSLLDALRSTDVVSGEAGGITQHIGAYQVELESGARITFLDTPGHEAFSAMRQRGASVTDIVVLVVAADDSVQPQTIEALNHAKAAKVPIIVAINKVDKPDSDPDRVKQDLLQHELVAEDFGGEVQMVPVSALKKMGLDQLEEAILLQAELLELRANPGRSAEGVVVEAKLDRGRGTVTTILVRRGTLRVGDIVIAGAEWGRVRAMTDDRGQVVDTAGPSVPVEVLGFNGTPMAGDEVVVVDSESRAREITDFRSRRERDKRTAAAPRGSIQQMFDLIKSGESKELPVVIKADVQGSVEAIVATLDKLGTDEVMVRVLHSGVGGVNESDVTLAAASGGFILGFNVRANKQARDLAQQQGVDIRYYSIIYELIDDIKAALSGLLPPMVREKLIGNADIREVFNITKVGKVAGCRVTEGVVRRGAGVRLLRDNVVIHEGKLATLKRFKDEVREVRDGYECGMAFESYQDIQVGDVIECFEVEEVARTI